ALRFTWLQRAGPRPVGQISECAGYLAETERVCTTDHGHDQARGQRDCDAERHWALQGRESASKRVRKQHGERERRVFAVFELRFLAVAPRGDFGEVRLHHSLAMWDGLPR